MIAGAGGIDRQVQGNFWRSDRNGSDPAWRLDQSTACRVGRSVAAAPWLDRSRRMTAAQWIVGTSGLVFLAGCFLYAWLIEPLRIRLAVLEERMSIAWADIQRLEKRWP